MSGDQSPGRRTALIDIDSRATLLCRVHRPTTGWVANPPRASHHSLLLEAMSGAQENKGGHSPPGSSRVESAPGAADATTRTGGCEWSFFATGDSFNAS